MLWTSLDFAPTDLAARDTGSRSGKEALAKIRQHAFPNRAAWLNMRSMWFREDPSI